MSSKVTPRDMMEAVEDMFEAEGIDIKDVLSMSLLDQVTVLIIIIVVKIIIIKDIKEIGEKCEQTEHPCHQVGLVLGLPQLQNFFVAEKQSGKSAFR